MVYCAAFNCTNGSSKNQPQQEKVAFFSFPEKNPFRQSWIVKVKRKNWQPSKSSKLCSKHFEESCFEQNIALMESVGCKPSRLRLKNDAVPTLFLYSSTENEKKTTRSAFAKRRRLEVSNCCCIVKISLILPIFNFAK